ncbi:NPCBM/NEW2 domain-containing protein [Streptomyces sp. NBC_01433]|uniref:NPCBM/NEW2 domain-containing protein n=1 Tax=Streptomyces sp. NBC_01433 TaxID=2903864 RepID=UPI00224D6418|nr:NPCBM/NEW2 domain-containing protein [Streptomyces sp. NBC_01433]MCX4679157.1 NPCBM/NEW2 domain-containing protein [Streptomyces sp. NBC_01433]
MAHGQDGNGDGVLARREAQERRDRLKAEFGSRLRTLLDLAGLSSREFAQRYPAYKDSVIRFKYLPGKSLPPWDFLHDLLTEVTRRTDDPAGPQRRTELFTAYRQVLVDIGADVRGSDQNSLLLRLLDGEEALRRLGEELAEVRARENRLRTDQEEETRRSGRLAPGGDDRRHQLEEESRLLAERRDELVHRRGDLIAELDGCRARLAVLEEADGPGDLVPASSGSDAGLHRTTTPPMPPGPPTLSPGAAPKKSGRRRAVVLIGGAVAAVLLAGGGVAVGLWAAGTHDTTDRAAPPTSASPTPPTPSPTTPAPPSETPNTAAPSTTGAPSSPSPPPSSGTGSLVKDLMAFEDDGYLTGPMRVNLREYPIALHALASPGCETTATWQLDRTDKSLVTRVGVSDDSPTSASADFTIRVDSRTQFQRTMGVGETAEKVTVKLDGAYRVTLTINSCNGGGIGAWLDPVITK